MSDDGLFRCVLVMVVTGYIICRRGKDEILSTPLPDLRLVGAEFSHTLGFPLSHVDGSTIRD